MVMHQFISCCLFIEDHSLCIWHVCVWGVLQAFPITAARTWNSLPPEMISSTTLPSFKSQLKTYLFFLSFSGVWFLLFWLKWLQCSCKFCVCMHVCVNCAWCMSMCMYAASEVSSSSREFLMCAVWAGRYRELAVWQIWTRAVTAHTVYTWTPTAERRLAGNIYIC